MNKERIINCSFCGKSQHEVQYLVAGPEVYICDECTDISIEAIGDRAKEDGVIRELISRHIEFPPEYRSAGVSILQYFSEILSTKYPEKDIKVRIQQSGLKVKLMIETPEGDREEIEKALDEYGMVVRGKISPEQYMGNELQAMALRNKLELTTMELRVTKELLSYSKQNSEERITSLEQQVTSLHQLLGRALDQSPKIAELRELINLYANNKIITSSIHRLEEIVRNGVHEQDEHVVKEILTEIGKENSSALSDIHNVVIGTISGASGTMLSSWISAIISAWPK